MAFGVTTSGFSRKRLVDIKAEIEASLRETLGNTINLLPESKLGQLVGVFAERESDLWELAEAVYNSGFPDTSEGVNLDNVMAIIAVSRLSAKKSVQQNLHLRGTLGASIPALTQVRVPGNESAVFETQATVTLVAGQDEVQKIQFSLVPTSGSWRLRFNGNLSGVLAFNISAAALQTALRLVTPLEDVTVTGDFTLGFTINYLGNAGKIDHPLIEVVDNLLLNGVTAVTTTVTELTAGIPQGVVDAECVNTGPIPATKYSLTEIVNPVSGLDSVINPTDAVVGRDVESDADLRSRSKSAQMANGKSTVEAIRVALLELEGVSQAIVFENDTLVTDVNGLPAKSIRAYVQGGDNADILQAIWENKAGGIYPDGAISGNITDSQGIVRTMRFSRPTQVAIYMDFTITAKTGVFPADGADQVRAALAAYINGLDIGEDVIVYPQLIASLNSIAGITDIVPLLDTDPGMVGASDANIVIGIAEIARVLVPATDIQVTVNLV